MKIKTSAHIQDPEGKTSSTVIRHLQSLTDDVRTILQGGLNFNEGQLPFQTVDIFVKNNQSFPLSMQGPYRIIGCFPIQTNNTKILNFKTDTNQNVFNVTVEIDTSTANIRFLMVGTNT